MKPNQDSRTGAAKRASSAGGAADSYRGEEGARYFADHFQPRQNFGRQYQANYFRPYCDERAVVLDFGCGDGTILRELPAARKIGVEVNPLCRERVNEANCGLAVPIEFHERLEDLPDGCATVAISNHCLEHVESPIHSLRAIWSKLARGGRLVLVTPYDDWRSQVHRAWTPQDSDHHLHTWSPRNLGNLVEVGGFQMEECRICKFTMSPKLYWIHQKLGDGAFRIACRLFSIYKCRREVFCLARKA